MRFDAVAFDLDGTLYPTLSLFVRALPLALASPARFWAFNTTRRQIRRMGAAEGYEGPRDGDGFRRLQAELAAPRLGMSLEAAAALIDRFFYGEIESLFSRVRPFGGLERALDARAGAGLRLALLSDLPPWRKLELMGLSGRFEPSLCSEDSGRLKPAAAPFELLTARLGLPKERILYVGNSPAIDLAGAKAAGMAAALVSRRRVEGADLCFYDWDRLVAFALTPAGSSSNS